MPRYRHTDLVDLAQRLLEAAGMETEKAQSVATILTEGDLIGHTTHGLRLLAPYLSAIANGTMSPAGEPEVRKDTGATFAWDGKYLPGPWLVERALEVARERVRTHGVVWGAVARSHHIACLGAYPAKPASEGLVCLLTTSDPAVKTIAPFGGREPLYTPNPIAAGIPTGTDPVVIDMSTSATANGVVELYRAQGRRLPDKWLLDNAGNATDDPNALFTDPPGSILPLGGVDLGYKGFALGLIVEALTSGLGGIHGRADSVDQWGASFSVCLIDPESFGGASDFTRQVSSFVEACRANPPRPGVEQVMVPGDIEMARKERWMSEGLELDERITDAISAKAEELGVKMPPAFA